MRIRERKKKRLSLLCCPLLAIVFYIAPVYAEDLPPPSVHPGNIKGFFEVDLSTQVVTRTVVEEISPGVNFEGDAESTRVLAKVATRPWRPVEFYLQAGTANLVIDEFNDYRGDYGLAYGGGVSLTVYEYPGPKKFQVITRADTLNFETKDHVLTVIQSQDVFAKETIRWREYTLEGIGLWRSQYWEPYIGARFSWLDSRDTIEDPRVGRLSLEEDSNLGLVAGTNLFFDPRENFALNIEATLIDQFSLKIGLKVWY
ncbi:MAG: hypothetical protein HZA18_07375 [Nitrospirae bacterium]|nr:hypothetical protein [Nitrospirota bacterium]MBI5407498.1 hypothetical protein [Nitrospirota bacterium]